MSRTAIVAFQMNKGDEKVETARCASLKVNRNFNGHYNITRVCFLAH